MDSLRLCCRRYHIKKRSMIYKERFYRSFADTARWKSFRVKVETTDLLIRVSADAHVDELTSEALEIAGRLRDGIRRHIEIQPSFLYSFSPVETLSDVPVVVDMMYKASEKANVGPIAAVAGAIAECVGLGLLKKSDEVIVENGGDIWLCVTRPMIVSVFAGMSSLSNKAHLNIKPDDMPLGICTSSGRVGHSFSFGKADAVTIISKDAALADAVATATGNIVKTGEDIVGALEFALSINGVKGALAICQDKIGILGDVELTGV